MDAQEEPSAELQYFISACRYAGKDTLEYMRIEASRLYKKYNMSSLILRNHIQDVSDLKLKEIPLTQGQVALVLEEHFEEINKHKWSAEWVPGLKTFIATRNGSWNGKKKRDPKILMHREILNAPKWVQVDHIDHNGLHNYPPNIRLDLYGLNNCNRRLKSTNTSGFKGVSKKKKDRRWRAYVGLNGKVYYFGQFDTAIEAARAYNAGALLLHGEFACLNEIPEDATSAQK